MHAFVLGLMTEPFSCHVQHFENEQEPTVGNRCVFILKTKQCRFIGHAACQCCHCVCSRDFCFCSKGCTHRVRWAGPQSLVVSLFNAPVQVCNRLNMFFFSLCAASIMQCPIRTCSVWTHPSFGQRVHWNPFSEEQKRSIDVCSISFACASWRNHEESQPCATSVCA